MRKSLLSVWGVTAVGLVAIFAAACSSSDDSSPPPPVGAGKAPPITEIRDVDPVTGTVDMYMPVGDQQVLAPGADPGKAALGYVAANAALLGITDPNATYVVDGVLDDEDATSVRLQQVVLGVPVMNTFKMVHFTSAGAIAFVEGAYVPNLEPIAKTKPVIDDATARALAESTVRAEDGLSSTTTVKTDAPRLVVYVTEDMKGARLALDTEVAVGDPANGFSQVVIDALTGAVITRWKTVTDAAPKQVRVSTKGMDGKLEKLPVVEEAADPASPNIFRRKLAHFYAGRLPTTNRGELDVSTYAEGTHVNGLLRSGPWDTQAVSAVANIERCEGFFSSNYGWKVNLNNKVTPLAVLVHQSGDLNAYGGADRATGRATITFTDGAAGETPFASSLGIVGHEMTHVVHALSNGLGETLQARSIGEGIADVFGLSILSANRGSEIFVLAEINRDAKQPLRFPNQVDNYAKFTQSITTGHYNATIVSNAWYLMTKGGKNETSQRLVANELGTATSQRLWWSSLRRIVGPRTTMPTLARAQVALATKKGIDTRPVACAWYATGVLGKSWLEKQDIDCTPTKPDAGAPDAEIPDAGPVVDSSTPDKPVTPNPDPGVDAGYGGCAHDVCSFGEALGPQCSPCMQKVCDVDKYCCTEHWGPSCWYALEAQCGVKCR